VHSDNSHIDHQLGGGHVPEPQRKRSRFEWRSQLYTLASGAVTRLQHPSGAFDSAVFGQYGEIVAQWQDATHAAQVISLDSHTGHQTRILLPAAEMPPSRPWLSVTFPSSDGQQIQGWLAVPEGTGPFPCVLATHGGPTAAQLECFSPGSQAWLDHGFAFLTINYRGSTTFGHAFERQIWGDIGHWEVEDMVAARRWLVVAGIAHPDRILLTGWSYGGYLTL
jgi:dipeptidyl aminopeptidase/acylaminoacyl peptidase